MSINNINGLGAGNAMRGDTGRATSVRADRTNMGTGAADASATDALSLSGRAERLQGAQAALAGIPEVDMERVMAIKQAIADGNYPVDAAKLAERMLQLESVLGS